MLFRFGHIRAMNLCAFIVFALWCMGMYGGWFDVIPQYDKFLHLLGGFTCGILGVAMVEAHEFLVALRSIKAYNKALLHAALVATFWIGGLWEIAEYFIPFMQDPSGWNFWDTFFDCCADIVGCIIAVLVYRREYHNEFV